MRPTIHPPKNTAIKTISANATKPPWNDVRVREALYRVGNRKQYLDLIQGGLGKVPPGPLPVGLTDYQLTDGGEVENCGDGDG